jgi:hypothetical protein
MMVVAERIISSLYEDFEGENLVYEPQNFSATKTLANEPRRRAYSSLKLGSLTVRH